jgi:hypothetical protein
MVSFIELQRFFHEFKPFLSDIRCVDVSLSELVDTDSLLLPFSLLSHTRPLPVTLGFYYASHFRLPLLLPSAPIDLSGPIV